MARTILSQTHNFSKRDMVNARNGFSLQSLDDGTKLAIHSCAVIHDDKSNPTYEGEHDVAILITDDGTAYTAISATVVESTHDIIDIMNELEDSDEMLYIRVCKRTSKGGKEFLTLTLL